MELGIVVQTYRPGPLRSELGLITRLYVDWAIHSESRACPRFVYTTVIKCRVQKQLGGEMV